MVFVKIQVSEKSNGNKGSSAQMVNYLEKEDIAKENKALDNNELPEKRSGFFSHENDNITPTEVIESIDNNKKALGKEDSKFYSITISPSEKEQQFILKDITGKDNINSIDELTKPQKVEFENKLKDYSRNVMDEYAKNFKRDGLNDGSQLVYFGKVEHERNYKGTDKEVKEKLHKSGEQKTGLNSHIHIVVSRKDNEQRLKLSPLANEKARESNSKLGNKSVVRGFDRVNFKEKSEAVFDKTFDYDRSNPEKVKTMIEKSKDRRNSEEKLFEAPQPEVMTKLYNGKDKTPGVSNHPDIVRKRSFIKRNERLREIVKADLEYKKKFTRDLSPQPDYDMAVKELVKEEKKRIKNKDFEL